MQPLGKRLRELRAARGLSMREAAERVGVQHTTWSRWEGGQTIPTRDSLRLIAERFNEDLTDYFRGRLDSARKTLRLEGRIWSMMGEQNVVETFSIGDHTVELLEDGNLLINARVLVLTES